jgi:pyruvate dehydrogenase E1 component
MQEILDAVVDQTALSGAPLTSKPVTPYINTIPADQQPAYPGDLALEAEIEAHLRWNAVAMVVRANQRSDGIGGHLATYASMAQIFEVGLNHFFKGPKTGLDRDLIFFQGHTSPGLYSRAFFEGRLTQEQLVNFRREHQETPGIPSYPHPWLMPDFWEFPTVSMGLGPMMAIYQARFHRYLENRSLLPANQAKIWAFLGDGEMDEPESTGALSIAAREKLGNLIFVVNCNLQRLDGPVRGNSKIIQELEGLFRGAGWRVIKVIWSSAWDDLLAREPQALLERLGSIIDGEYQRLAALSPADFRSAFFAGSARLEALGASLSDAEIASLLRGGHDPVKIYAAMAQAIVDQGIPTVLLIKTIKGYKLGKVAEGKNITHQQKKLKEAEILEFRDRLGLSLADDQARDLPFLKPSAQALNYLQERRSSLGGSLPARVVTYTGNPAPDAEFFAEFFKGSGDREVSTTMAFVSLLTKLLKHPDWGRYIVPIIPDEARTFGMESLFRQIGIYAPEGQLYEPIDRSSLLYYREEKSGQILEEGITEAGAVSSFVAAGTAYATYGLPMVPFYIFYSMFGLQRIGDQVWAAADLMTKGFLLGATAGRTTLAGEGLQHQDGQSHVLGLPVPNMRCYDPAFAFELSVIVREGLRRMYQENIHEFYYLTVGNQNYLHPAMPEGVEAGIMEGGYLFRKSPLKKGPRVRLLGSGAIMTEVLQAATWLTEQGVAADIYSITSYKNLYISLRDAERLAYRSMSTAPSSYASQLLGGDEAPVVAASDYMKCLPDLLRPVTEAPWISLGTDGFGRSEARAELRQFFEVDWRHIAYAALSGLVMNKSLKADKARAMAAPLKVDPQKANPWGR